MTTLPIVITSRAKDRADPPIGSPQQYAFSFATYGAFVKWRAPTASVTGEGPYAVVTGNGQKTVVLYATLAEAMAAAGATLGVADLVAVGPT